MLENKKLDYPATGRNKEVILEVLQPVLSALPSSSLVLEIASGSGQHAIYFGDALPHLRWQPTDPDSKCLESIAAWLTDSHCDNVLPPLELNVHWEEWPLENADALFCANMIHIAPWSATEALFRGASACLSDGAPLLLYGPFLVKEQPTAPSNERFDKSLQHRNPAWGIRWLHEVSEVAQRWGFSAPEVTPMPANNLTVLYRRHCS